MRLINRKVRYITYIAREVGRIKDEGFDIHLQERADDELAQLSIGINSMSKKMKEDMEYKRRVEQERNELITNVSHDLRTPLTSVIGYLQLLKEDGFDQREKFDEYMEVIERRVTGLKGLIDELFEYSKLSSTSQVLEYSRMDIVPILCHLLQEYKLIYQKENLGFELNLEMTSCNLLLDVNKFIRVLQNLLDNARKYTKKEGMITVNCYQTKEHFVFEIQNDVEDASLIDTKRLFDRFYMADSARSSHDSSGLGLEIVKRIIELHDGELNVNLEDGKIMFQIRLKVVEVEMKLQ